MKTQSLFLLPLLLLAGCETKDRFVGAPPANPYPNHGAISDTAATIIWRTDVPASSEVQFGTNTSYPGSAGNPNERVTFHKVDLSGLPSSSLIHYRIRSNQGQDIQYSYDRQFSTLAPGQPDPGAFTFEFDDAGGLDGWEKQTYFDSQSASAISLSNVQTYLASPMSMRMDVDLRFGNANLSKGEAFVTFANAPTNGGREFRSLNSVVITALVFCPVGAGGPHVSNKNGIQLFVKDGNFRSQYGPFFAVGTTIPEGSWQIVTMTVNANGAGNAFTTAGFDPTNIIIAGIKIGTSGSNPGVIQTYAGPIYVDHISY